MNAAIGQPIIFVEDDDELRIATAQALELAGFQVKSFASAEAALGAITGAFDGVIVSDIRMPGMDGIQLLGAVQSIDRDIPLILVTGHGDVQIAVGALKKGAFDFLSKPFVTDHLVSSVRRASERRALQIENRRLRAAAEASDAESPLIGTSMAMARMRSVIRQLAAADLDVLIEGETGVGKEVVAQLLHALGPRAGRPFVAVNCAAWVEANFELALFGQAADSAGSRFARKGSVALSSGGTLLLDEIDSMPLAMQTRLLRVLEEREVQPLGAERPELVDLHVVATSKIDLEKEAASGRFRADLFHRLAMTRLRVPPLRERENDALLLFDIFIEEAKSQLGRPDFVVPRAATRRLQRHDWPGNVRELRNYAFSTVIGQLAPKDESVPAQSANLKDRVAAFETDVITQALRDSRGNVGKAIAQLGLPRKTFYDKVARLKIDLADLRASAGNKAPD